MITTNNYNITQIIQLQMFDIVRTQRVVRVISRHGNMSSERDPQHQGVAIKCDF